MEGRNQSRLQSTGSRLSASGPSAVTQTLFRQLLFLSRVDLCQLAHEPGPREFAPTNPLIVIHNGPPIQRDGDSLSHLASMTRHPAPVQSRFFLWQFERSPAAIAERASSLVGPGPFRPLRQPSGTQAEYTAVDDGSRDPVRLERGWRAGCGDRADLFVAGNRIGTGDGVSPEIGNDEAPPPGGEAASARSFS